MADLRSRLIVPLAVAVGGLVVIGAVWFGAQTQVRFALWQSVAEQPLSPREGERLARCDRKPGWWTWVKVLDNDRPVPCGEGWAIDRMADKIEHSADRRRWVRQYVQTPDTPAARRLRASLLLNIVGEPTPEEPAWLATEPGAALTPEHGAEQAQAEAWPWAVHLGPRYTARGTLLGMAVADFAAAEVVGPFEALWALDDPDTDAMLVRLTALGMAVPPTLSEDRWYRRRQGRPSETMPRGWSRIVLGRTATCSGDGSPSEGCLELWRDLLVHEASLALDDPFEVPLWPATLPEVLPMLEPAGRRTRAVEWWMQAAEDWVRAAPDPDRRLASLARGPVDAPTRAHPIAVLDRRAGTPFVTAAVLLELGRRTGRAVSVTVDDDGTVWITVGEETVTRTRCGTLAPSPPEQEPWTATSVSAGALLEAAREEQEPLQRARLLAAAHRLDPDLSLQPALPDDRPVAQQVAFDAGARLFEAPPLVGDAERAAIGPKIGAACPPAG